MIFLVALLGSIGATSYYYVQTNKVVTEQVYSHLESVVQSRGNHIETFLNEKKILAENLALIGKVETLLLDPSNANILAVEERLQKTVDSVESILSIGVIDKNNILISSTKSELIGLDYSETIFFKGNPEREAKIDFIDDPVFGVILGIVSPVYHSTTKEYLGMVGIALDTKELNDITLDKTGIGETGETYLINKDNYALTPLLFKEDVILEFKVHSINSINCLNALNNPVRKEGEHIGHKEVETFLDYRSEKVIGAHYPIQETQWCLLAEMDEEEILTEQRELFQRSAILIIIIVTFVITLIGFFIGRYLDNIVVLRKGKKSL